MTPSQFMKQYKPVKVITETGPRHGFTVGYCRLNIHRSPASEPGFVMSGVTRAHGERPPRIRSQHVKGGGRE